MKRKSKKLREKLCEGSNIGCADDICKYNKVGLCYKNKMKNKKKVKNMNLSFIATWSENDCKNSKYKKMFYCLKRDGVAVPCDNPNVKNCEQKYKLTKAK